MREIFIKSCLRKGISIIIITSVLIVSSAFAQTSQHFDAEVLVSNGKNQDEESISIQFNETSVTFLSKKAELTKTFNYADIKLAEYSYSKKPRYTTGAILGLAISVFLLPLMFTKSKKHWMTVQTEKDYVVLKLKKSNYRLITPSFETHGVKVTNTGNQNNGRGNKEQ